MRRKRFKHHVGTFCDIFCGWQLGGDHSALAHLGTGQLRIDILHASCFHNSVPVPRLEIAETIREWFHRDIADSHMQLENVTTAELVVDMTIHIESGAGASVRARFDCTGRLKSGNDAYEAARVCDSVWSVKGLASRKHLRPTSERAV